MHFLFNMKQNYLWSFIHLENVLSLNKKQLTQQVLTLVVNDPGL